MKSLLFFMWIFIVPSSFYAQEINTTDSIPEQPAKPEIEFNGYIKGLAYGAGENYDYLNLYSEFSLQSKFAYSQTFLFADIRFRTGLQFDNRMNEFQIKEAYAAYSGNKFDAFLGNQIITWGRTEGFSPVNNLLPNDYFFLSDEPDDQKLSNFMLRLKYRLSHTFNIEVITIPVYKASEYRYDLFNFAEHAQFTETGLPNKQVENATLATRLNFDFSEIGFSLSAFRGFDTFYGFNINTIDFSSGFPLITYSPKPYLKTALGFETEIPVNSLIIRFDGAYNMTEHYIGNMNIPNPDVSYVVAIETNLGGFNAILQYIGKYTLDFTEQIIPILLDPMNPLSQMQYANDLIYYESESINRKIFHQQKETNHSLALTLNKSFLYQTINAEITGYYDISSEEYMIRPQVSYKMTDMLTASIGGLYMQGPEKSIFNYSKPVMNGVFLSLKAGF